MPACAQNNITLCYELSNGWYWRVTWWNQPVGIISSSPACCSNSIYLAFAKRGCLLRSRSNASTSLHRGSQVNVTLLWLVYTCLCMGRWITPCLEKWYWTAWYKRMGLWLTDLMDGWVHGWTDRSTDKAWKTDAWKQRRECTWYTCVTAPWPSMCIQECSAFVIYVCLHV